MQFNLKNLFGRTQRKVTPHEAQTMIQQGARVIDVREPDEFAHGTIPNSENLPLSRIERDGVAAIVPLIAGHEPLILICRSGARSTAACARLQDVLGERVLNLEGGLLAWVGDGLPVHHPHALVKG